MCGISGFFTNEIDSTIFSDSLRKMSKKLEHRGPDDCGIWFDENIGVALAHQRLSIVDLSIAGRQPMGSHCGRYLLTFNGEIYNHLSIRKEIKDSIKWKSHSDTETLINAISIFGIETTLKKITGMFSFALWDKKNRQLTLARDRVGEKPLYYGFFKDTLLFASELKAINAFPNYSPTIDREALYLYMKYGYVPAPYSMYKNIYKLLPGTYLTFSKKDLKQNSMPDEKKYWSLDNNSLEQMGKLYKISENEAIDLLEELLKKSISEQLLGDVPIGVFLSGGLDSTSIVSLIQSQSLKPIQTFNVGFNESEYDESSRASAISEYIGTIHHKIILSPSEALEVIPSLPTLYDEPFSDISQIPTYLISKFASKYVKVALSGDGGDELFCGYNRHILCPKIWSILKKIPLPLRNLIANFIQLIPPSNWENFYYFVKLFLPKYLKLNSPSLKFEKFSKILNSKTLFDVYLCLINVWDESEEIVLGHKETKSRKYLELNNLYIKNPHHQIMLWDSIGYLPNDILVKVDRAAMGCSLETRMPLLDHRIIEFAWSLPISMKLRNNKTKWILKEVMKHYLPQELIDGHKTGFSVPIGKWLKGPLREWANDLLDPNLIHSQKYLSNKIIQKKWKEHLSGNNDWSSQLWTVLMFQSWIKNSIN